MVKIKRDFLAAIQSELETVDSSWQEEFNLKETVRECFYLIQNARKHKVSWERITAIIKTQSGATEEISPLSVSKYYLEFVRNPKSLPKKTRRKNDSKKKKNDKTEDSGTGDESLAEENGNNTQADHQETEVGVADRLLEAQVNLVEEENFSSETQANIEPEEQSEEIEKLVEDNSKKKFGGYYDGNNKSVKGEFNI